MDDLQEQVREWRARQTDLVPCQALKTDKIRLEICKKRQRTHRHFASPMNRWEFDTRDDRDTSESERISIKFAFCKGCKYFKPRHVTRRGGRRAYVRGGKMPKNFEKETFDAR